MKMLKRWSGVIVTAIALTALASRAGENPFVGRWAFTLSDGQPGWLGLESNGGEISAALLWGRGSVVPMKAEPVGAALQLTRPMPRKDDGSRQRIVVQLDGRGLRLITSVVAPGGQESSREILSARRIPDLPAPPNLAAIRFSRPIQLLKGALSAHWIPVDAQAPNGWTLVDGVLANRVAKPGPRSANLRTRASYEDFMLTAEVRTLPGSNSGLYLRGVYEIQIADTFGKPPDGHSMGALYTRIVPRVPAERPVGQWQSLRIILVSRHVSVWLNGTLIIDNQPALGCTGGALTSDELSPGPLMLQGDHSDIDFRAIELSPVEK